MDFEKDNLDKNLKNNVITKLEKLLELNNNLMLIYKSNKDDKSKTLLFKIRNYEKWLTQIKLLESKIFKSKEKILELKSDSLKKKIIEINNTNKLKELEDIEKKILELQKINEFNDKKQNKNNDFKKIDNLDMINLVNISGIAESTAMKLLKKNIKFENLLDEFESLENKDLYIKYKKIDELFRFYSGNNRNSFIKNKLKDTKYLKELNYGQIVGLKYYSDILQRIPRKEIEEFEKLISIILKSQKDIIFKICGSYRRGKKDSGDIDILISNIKSDKSCILSFVKILIELGILVDHLTINGNNKYMGMGKIPNEKYKVFRRIDIKYVKMESFACSLLYFTGSANLNKDMRRKAIKKGYKLSEYGLLDKTKNINLETPTEKSIFDLLEMNYLEPFERNI